MKLLVICALVGTLGVVVETTADRGAELVAARELYAGADYSGALTILNGLSNSATPADAVPIQQYRALCYLALGNAAEAQHALETIVLAAPFYRSSGSDMSPRLESSFAEVRQRVLPSVVQRKYATAKAAYERHDYEISTAEFRDVLQLLDDPDLGTAARGPLADLRLVAAGFVDLSVRASTPRSAPPRPATAAGTRPSGAGRSADIYTAASAGVVPPVAIRQTLPAYAATGQMLPLYIGSQRNPIEGAIEVTIAEDGKVINAKMRVSTKTPYDLVALAAANRWQYKPASLDGAPVKYLKVVNIKVAAAP
jgi:hypothetical protein